MTAARIDVEPVGPDRWRVRLGGGTEHEVTAAAGSLRRAAAADGEEAADTLRRTFEFLLEREPATSILRRFELDDVARYFPEFWSVMAGTE